MENIEDGLGDSDLKVEIEGFFTKTFEKERDGFEGMVETRPDPDDEYTLVVALGDKGMELELGAIDEKFAGDLHEKAVAVIERDTKLVEARADSIFNLIKEQVDSEIKRRTTH